MGIDVYLYHYHHGRDQDFDTHTYDKVPNLEGGYIRESYFRNNIYATKILFEEAWTKEQTHLQPNPDELRKRLPFAINATEMRYRNLPGESSPNELKEAEIDQIKQIKRFVDRYIKEKENGFDPFISVSY